MSKKRIRRTVEQLLPVWLEAANNGDEVAKAKYDKAMARKAAKEAAKTSKRIRKNPKEPKQVVVIGETTRIDTKAPITNAKHVKVTKDRYNNEKESSAKDVDIEGGCRHTAGSNKATASHNAEVLSVILKDIYRYCLMDCCRGRSKLSAAGGSRVTIVPDCSNTSCVLYRYRKGTIDK